MNITERLNLIWRKHLLTSINWQTKWKKDAPKNFTEMICHLNLTGCYLLLIFQEILHYNYIFTFIAHALKNLLAYLCNFNKGRTIGNNVSMCEHCSLWTSCWKKKTNSFCSLNWSPKNAKKCQDMIRQHLKETRNVFYVYCL